MEPILKPPTTLAILFGASEFPERKDLPAFASFARSVEAFRSYLLEKLGVQPDNIKNLFDSDAWPGQLNTEMKEWIGKRKQACRVSDVLFFYVGHGVLDSGAFRMASRVTREGSEVTDSSLSSKSLKNVLYNSTSGANIYVILDCCYAASAHPDFQDTSSNSSAVLYTAAGARKEAIAGESELYTRFSDALFAALAQGLENTEDDHLSFRQLEAKVDEIYKLRYPAEFVKPQLGTPNAPRVNVLELPVFPNPGFKATPRHYEYYTHWIRRNGAPEGLGPITDEQVKRKKISTRMLREKGRIRKVETVNSSGLLTANYYNTALLGGSPDGQDQECAWEFAYDENGRVAREEVRNAFGRLLYRCEYSVTDQAETTARYFLNPSDVVQPRARSGAAYVKISRNDSGLDQRLEFFDGFEQKQPDDRGSYGQERELSAEGVAIRTVELDRAGNPAVCNEGYALAEYTTNPFGNTTSQGYFDSERRPVFHKDGYHKALIAWSPEGNLTSMEFFGTDGKPVLIKNGWASWKATYDESGHQIRQDYFGLDDNPVTIRDGYASWEASYDEQGRMVTLRFLDTQGLPAYSRDGITRIAYDYDASGQINEYRYLEADGTTPGVDRESVSRLALTFDKEGNLTKQLNWGANGRLTRNIEGAAGYEGKFDASGNQILLTYLDLDGAPGPNNSGITKTRRCYDNRRRMTEESYFDADDKPVENSDGHHRIAYDYGESPGRKTIRYFDREGAPAFFDGYCSSVAQYDDRERMVSCEYRGSAGQPCWNAKGFVREQRSYDSLSRQLGQLYLGLDGKPVITSMGHAGWNAAYDPQGNCTRMVYVDAAGEPLPGRPIETYTYDAYGNYRAKFLNPAGEPVLNTDGVSERRVIRDARGNDIGSTYWGLDGKPAKRRDGFAAWEAGFDRFSNKIWQRLLDESGAPAAEQNGTSRTTWTYDSKQRKTSATFWGVDGNRLMLKPDGYGGWEAQYDDRGHQIELSYFAADGETPVDCQYGYARVVSVYAGHLGPVKREWFRANGDSLSTLTVSYDGRGGRTETEPGESGGAVVRSFDRAGHETRCEYFRADGTQDAHLEGSRTFCRFEEDFDSYGRSIEKRYYDATAKVFESIRKTYDTAGNETERVEVRYGASLNHTTRTVPLPDGKQIEVFLTDPENKPAADELGRSRWLERLDDRGLRISIDFFDIEGNPALVHGHYSAKYKYDELGCATEAIYSFPVDEDSILIKKFRLGSSGSPHVQIQSVDKAAKCERHDGYLLEYAMKPGECICYVSGVESPGNSPFELRMRQRCDAVRPDGSYVVSVEVIPPGGDWQSHGQYVCEMAMARNGRILEASIQSDFSTPPMPAYPVFPGDTWQMEVDMNVQNPFTNETQKVTLDYSYLLRDFFDTGNGFRLAQIEVECPKTRVPLGPAAAWTISASGVNLFEVDKGFLFVSKVQSQIITSVGTDELVSNVGVITQYDSPQEQISVAGA